MGRARSSRTLLRGSGSHPDEGGYGGVPLDHPSPYIYHCSLASSTPVPKCPGTQESLSLNRIREQVSLGCGVASAGGQEPGLRDRHVMVYIWLGGDDQKMSRATTSDNYCNHQGTRPLLLAQEPVRVLNVLTREAYCQIYPRSALNNRRRLDTRLA